MLYLKNVDLGRKIVLTLIKRHKFLTTYVLLLYYIIESTSRDERDAPLTQYITNA